MDGEIRLSLGRHTSACIAGNLILRTDGREDATLICADQHVSATLIQRIPGVTMTPELPEAQVVIPSPWLRDQGVLDEDEDVTISLRENSHSLNGVPIPPMALSPNLEAGNFEEWLREELTRRRGDRRVQLHAASLDWLVRRVGRGPDYYLSLVVGKRKKELMLVSGKMDLDPEGRVRRLATVRHLEPLPSRNLGALEKRWITLRAGAITQVFRDIVHVLDRDEVVTLHIPKPTETQVLIVTCESRPDTFIAGARSIRALEGGCVLENALDQLEGY